jgi:hypothetical protein
MKCGGWKISDLSAAGTRNPLRVISAGFLLPPIWWTDSFNCGSGLAREGVGSGDDFLADRVHIHHCGNGCLWFRPDGDSLFLQAGKRLKKVSKKTLAPTFGPLAKARGSFAPGFIRGHRLRCASLHLLSMCSTSSNGATRPPPDESLHSACRRGRVDQELQPS